jgi:electron transport complex protein RnfD
MKTKFLVSSSPHIGSNLTTKKIMLHVIIALGFPVIASTVIFGLYSLFIVLLAVGASVLGETLYNLIRKRPNTVPDLSAVVTGLILGMNLPPTVPFYVPIVGGIFAIMVVKMPFGGLGQNFANPAATARIFLSLAWPVQMTKFMNPLNYSNGAKDFVAGFTKTYVTSATPLVAIKDSIEVGGISSLNLLDMFLGRIGGSIGEVCSLTIIIAAVYLIVTKVIDWKILVTYVVTCAVLALAFYKDGYLYVLPTILSGGILFAGVFMLTDYTTSPRTELGRIIFAVFAGLFTMIVRRFGGMPEGACYSVLLANLIVPFIDKIVKPKPFGYVKPKKERKKKANV